ncbi:hypothetical protein DEU34_1314 [Microbacterium sp. AG1240]|uniref:hypothetical protein n=1 Tax=Microbacterium sp. AG1240 TaxID=2183992 RepID=UPI000EB16D2D|nr:hypothetical protein [Microbacterium sp. AG1240]RKT36789.1 hypothetical protein DEU34_1314 [Microbacterium sp. AG1240]
MQLGTRWTSGSTPPSAVPASLHAQIAAVETSLPADQFGQPAPRWTLTWLEGRPVVELDTGIIVTLDRSGEAVVTHHEHEQFSDRDYSGQD